MCLGTIMFGHNRVWAQSCLGTNVSGHKYVWAQMCLGTNVSGHKHVWAQTCLGTNMCGHKRVWAQTCVSTAQSCGPSCKGPIMYGHKRGGTIEHWWLCIQDVLLNTDIYINMHSRMNVACCGWPSMKLFHEIIFPEDLLLWGLGSLVMLYGNNFQFFLQWCEITMRTRFFIISLKNERIWKKNLNKS